MPDPATSPVETSMIYLLVAGLMGRSDRRAGIAAVIVAGESLVFAANAGTTD